MLFRGSQTGRSVLDYVKSLTLRFPILLDANPELLDAEGSVLGLLYASKTKLAICSGFFIVDLDVITRARK